jgi:hypothetical protein
MLRELRHWLYRPHVAGGQFTHPDHLHENAQFISYLGESGFR